MMFDRTWHGRRAVIVGLCGSAAMVAASTVGVAAAQTTSTPAPALAVPPPATDPAQGDGLQDIIVTAQRREESLQKVPIAVTVLTPQDIARQNVADIRDLNRVAPGLSVNGASSDRNSVNYVIRGFGLASNSGGDPAVITYFAEVPQSISAPGLVFDLQNIQILKGPQGTLFGRNTTGGAVLIEPARPGNSFGGYVEGTVGDYNLHRVQAALDLPIVSDHVLARVALDSNHRDGFTKDIGLTFPGKDYDDRNYDAVRFSLTLKDGAVEDRFTLGYTSVDTNGGGIVVDSVNPTGLAVTRFPQLTAFVANQRRLGVRKVNYLIDAYSRQKILAITNTASYELSDHVTLKNIFGYTSFRTRAAADVVGTPRVIEVLPSPYLDDGSFGFPSSVTATDEVQLQARALDDRLALTVGGFYYYSKPAEPDQQSFNYSGLAAAPAATSVAVRLRRDRSKAVYGQASFKILDTLKLTIGGRYTWDDKALVNRSYSGDAAGNFIACTINPVIPQSNCTVRLKTSFSAPTGNISLDYQITPRVLIYATARHGFKSGGFNPSVANPDAFAFQPEYVTDYELGMKSQFDLGPVRARLNADIFNADFRDLQAAGNFFDPVIGRTVAQTINAGRGRIRGGELEATLVPDRHFELSGFLAILDPKYTSFSFNNNGTVVDLRNYPFQNSPKTKFGVTGVFNTDLPGQLGRIDLTANYAYQSTVYFNEQLTPTIANPRAGQDPYGVLNLRLDWKKPFGTPVDAYIFLTNVTDKIYKVQENDAYSSTGLSQALYGEPRMVGGGLRYSF